MIGGPAARLRGRNPPGGVRHAVVRAEKVASCDVKVSDVDETPVFRDEPLAIVPVTLIVLIPGHHGRFVMERVQIVV